MMPMNSASLRASSAYRKIHHESRAAAADPVELVSMLYEELETALGVLIVLAGRRQPILTTEPAHRVRTMLIALDAGLDHDAGGDLANSLSQIYNGMRRRFEQAATSGDRVALNEIAEGVASLRAAWDRIGRPIP
jgi:flagellar secretion chaperone FliS